MTELIVISVIVLATFRFTRFVTKDKLFAAQRLKAQRYFEERKERKTGQRTEDEWQSKLAYLFSCPWCLSVWIAIPVTISVDVVTSVPLPGLVPFVASAVTGMLASRT